MGNTTGKTPLLERVRTALRTLRDTEQAGLLLQGPLPLWMQDAFERAARETGVPVGYVIFEALRHRASRLQRRQRQRDSEQERVARHG